MKNSNSTIQESYVYDESQVDHVVDRLFELLQHCKVMTFSGSLGAGKTTLIRALLRKCGVQEPITSPTFNYVNAYTNMQKNVFYHFDLYRVASLESFCLSGFDEYLYVPSSWSFIEWPELIMPLLAHDVCHVNIEYVDDKRKASISCIS